MLRFEPSLGVSSSFLFFFLTHIQSLIECFTFLKDMHDSVPTGNLTELLGDLNPGPSSSTSKKSSSDLGALPQFNLDALHPYHILVGQSQISFFF